MSVTMCSICKAPAQTGDGASAFSPGCCGAWYHQTCIDNVLAAGGTKCPMCLKCLPMLLGRIGSQETRPSILDRMFRYSSSRKSTNSVIDDDRGSLTASLSASFMKNQEDCLDAPFDQDQYDLNSKRRWVLGRPIPLVVSTSVEYPKLPLTAVNEFFARVSIKNGCDYMKSLHKVPMDIVCVLDNSGSMCGSKISSLRTAMKFVINSLGPNDRLSIVNFNSSATALHGLLKMNPTNQATAKSAINALSANGGTNILDGMRTGWSILDSRQTKNPSSCMFLLTDGQDRDTRREQLILARAMKVTGTSLFVFGLGADHDSKHMHAIANAAEGVFTYIESDNKLREAFGGTIGAQQGQSLSHITLLLYSCSPNVRITEVMAGRYTQTLLADGRAASVSFVNMFLGETREVLVKLSVPAVTEVALNYELVRAMATFRVQGEPSAAPLHQAAQFAVCVVQRLPSDQMDPSLERDMEVDVQLNRLQVTAAIASSLIDYDYGRFGAARGKLQMAYDAVSSSVSLRKQHPFSVALQEEVGDALLNFKYFGSFKRGGRAMMQESVANNLSQRIIYCKVGRMPTFQNALSMEAQRNASAPDAYMDVNAYPTARYNLSVPDDVFF